MFLSDYLWGIIEDNVMMLSMHYANNSIGLDGDIPLIQQVIHSSQPIVPVSFYYITSIIQNAIFIWNLFVFITFILNLIFINKFFKNFFYQVEKPKKIQQNNGKVNNIEFHNYTINIATKSISVDKIIRYILTLVASLSPFVLFQSRNHIELMSVWILALGLHLIINTNSYKRAIFTGVFLMFSALYSNYYFYFLLIVLTLFTFFKVLFSVISRKKSKIILNLKHYGLVYLILFSLIIVLMWPVIYGNVFVKDSKIDTQAVAHDNTSWQVNNYNKVKFRNKMIIKRGLPDFFLFTGRPWYLIMPPKSNLYFGELSQTIENQILKIGTVSWLAHNYFESEHTAMYLGYVNLILAGVGVFYLVKNKKRIKKFDDLENLLILAIIALAILLLIMPPYIILKSHRIYMPSYVLYEVFPMFRVLTRFGYVLLLILLIFTGYGYRFIIQKVKNTALLLILLTGFVGFSLLEFIVPIKIVNASDTPKIYEEITSNTPNDSKIAIYPNYFTGDFIFWMKNHQRGLINPKDYQNISYKYDANSVTKNLTNDSGLLEIYRLGARYLLIKTKTLDSNAVNYFNTNKYLKKIAESDDGLYILYEIINPHQKSDN